MHSKRSTIVNCILTLISWEIMIFEHIDRKNNDNFQVSVRARNKRINFHMIIMISVLQLQSYGNLSVFSLLFYIVRSWREKVCYHTNYELIRLHHYYFIWKDFMANTQNSLNRSVNMNTKTIQFSWWGFLFALNFEHPRPDLLARIVPFYKYMWNHLSQVNWDDFMHVRALMEWFVYLSW